MKINKLMLIFSILFSLFGINCYSQEELKNKEKSEETARIIKEIEQYKEKYIPSIRNLLINDPRGLSKEELDSLIIEVMPTLIIDKESVIRLNAMTRIDSLVEGKKRSIMDYLYDFTIIPKNGKRTIYSSITIVDDDDKIGSVNASIYSKSRIKKYGLFTSRIGKPNEIILSDYPKKNSKSTDWNSQISMISKKGLEFWIWLDPSLYYYPSGIISNVPFKDQYLVIYNNRIYSGTCLQQIFKTMHLDFIFENPADSLCDCDIDVYFRQNITSDDYWKNKKTGK